MNYSSNVRARGGASGKRITPQATIPCKPNFSVYNEEPPKISEIYPKLQQPQSTSVVSSINQIDPMFEALAAQYGSTLADQGAQYVAQRVDAWLPLRRLRYYFCVDTPYVARKLAVLLAPFTHSDWSSQFDPGDDQAQIPRVEINAPDLYIPCMAVVTYFLTGGYVLGTQHRFTPDLLGLLASSTTAWLLLESVLVMAGVYLMNLSGPLVTFLDVLAFCSYKFVHMVLALGGYLLAGVWGYAACLAWGAMASCFFLLRSLRVRFMAAVTHEESKESLNLTGNLPQGSSENALYFILGIAVMQPIMIYTQTRHIVFFTENST